MSKVFDLDTNRKPLALVHRGAAQFWDGMFQMRPLVRAYVRQFGILRAGTGRGDRQNHNSPL